MVSWPAVLLGLAVLSALSALVAGALTLRRALGLERKITRHAEGLIDAARIEVKQLMETAEELLDRAHVERKRISGAKGGRPRNDVQPAGDEAATPWTRERYLAHVEKTGRSDPNIERHLGI